MFFDGDKEEAEGNSDLKYEDKKFFKVAIGLLRLGNLK
jgi:hypothetical protein